MIVDDSAVGESRGNADPAEEAGLIGKKLASRSAGGAGEDAHMRPASRTGAGHDLPRRMIEGTHIDARDAHATGEACIVGEPLTDDLSGNAIEDPHVWAAARSDAGDNIGDIIVRINAGGGHERAAAESRIVGVELAQHCAGGAVPNSHNRPASCPGRRDDLDVSVAVQVCGGDPDSAPERCVVGEETPHQITDAVVHVNHRGAAGASADGRRRP